MRSQNWADRIFQPPADFLTGLLFRLCHVRTH